MVQYLKIRELLLFAVFQFIFWKSGEAQLKEFSISPKGDTINAVDKNGLKQGKWVIHVDELRGEPGYETEGIFKDGKKEGTWRLYNLDGDLVGLENYWLGGKHGTQQYFTYLGDMVREEQWRGYNPDAPYDTIAVYGTGSNEIIDFKIVKAEQYSIRQGDWKYYEPGTGRLIKTERYELNRLVTPSTATAAVNTDKDKPKKKVEKTPEMLQWEKKNKGKKKVVRDGSTGL